MLSGQGYAALRSFAKSPHSACSRASVRIITSAHHECASRVRITSSLFYKFPVIGSIARGVQRLNRSGRGSMRGSMEPRTERFSR